MLTHFTSDRDEFVRKMLPQKGWERLIEVGVREGAFSRLLLETAPEAFVYGVDIAILPSARRLEWEFPNRYLLLHRDSLAASCHFRDGAFGMVYVDADHSYKAVKADLETWWPKVEPGGYLCGDDFAFVDNPGEGRYGVVEAVTEFADRLGLPLNVLGCGPSREEQLAYAREQGDLATRFLRGQYSGPRQNPFWWVEKPQ